MQVHYTAPTVWAWRSGRTKKISNFLDYLLTLFPFETSYFKDESLKTTFVGHPIILRKIDKTNKQSFIDTYSLKNNETLLCLLPGSRNKEIKFLLPIFKQVIHCLSGFFTNLVIVIPIANGCKKIIQSFLTLKNDNFRYILVEKEIEKYQAMSLSKAALAASGTVSLELAISLCPSVIAYKLNPLTYMFASKLITTTYVSIVNIISGKKIIPELLQDKCTASNIVTCLFPLLTETLVRKKQIINLRKVRYDLFSSIIDLPGFYAASSVLQLMNI